MVGAFDYCLFGKGGAAPSIDTAMHGLVESTHVDHLHPDSGIAFATAADGEALTRGVLRRSRRVGPVAPARVPAGPRHRGDPGRAPGGDRGGPRRPRDHRLGRHLRGVRGELARDHPLRPGVDRRARPAGSVRRADRRIRTLACRRAPGPGGRSPPGRPRPGLDGPSAGRLLHRQRGRPRLPVARGPSAAGRARDVVPGPLPADEGPADGPRPAADGAARGRDRPPPRAPRRVSRRVPRLLRAPRRARFARDARRRPGDRARARRRDVQLRRDPADRPRRRRVLRQRDQRHARRRGPLDLRAHRRSPRSSGSSTGRSRRRSSGGCRRRSRSRRGSRS